MTEWEATGIVLGSSAFGESDAVVSLLTESYGLHRGLVRGGRGRRLRGDWDVGNVLRARWRGRLADQLGAFSGELVAAPHAALVSAPLDLAVMASACAVAREGLAERGLAPATFGALLLLLARLQARAVVLPTMVRFEIALLAESGFGLDLVRCAVTGAEDGLAFVSPRTARAVTANAASGLESRLLRLPSFVNDEREDLVSAPADWADGLHLAGHFLSRDLFGSRHKGLPIERTRLAAMVDRLASPRLAARDVLDDAAAAGLNGDRAE